MNDDINALIASGALEDGEILGLDNDTPPTLLQWNGEENSVYNCGETIDQFGIHNVREHEAARIGLKSQDIRLAADHYHKTKSYLTMADLGYAGHAAGKPMF